MKREPLRHFERVEDDEQADDFSARATDPSPEAPTVRERWEEAEERRTVRARRLGDAREWVTFRLRSVPTWFWEQLVLVALLFLAMRLQAATIAPGGIRDLALVVLQGWAVLVGQKVRSIADRQAEANRAAGVRDARVECHRAQRRYGLVFQVIGLAVGLVAAVTWAHALVAAYVALYPLWRMVYRARIKPLVRDPDHAEDVQADLLLCTEVAGLREPDGSQAPSCFWTERRLRVRGEAARFLREHGARSADGAWLLVEGRDRFAEFLSCMSEIERRSYDLAQGVLQLERERDLSTSRSRYGDEATLVSARSPK